MDAKASIASSTMNISKPEIYLQDEEFTLAQESTRSKLYMSKNYPNRPVMQFSEGVEILECKTLQALKKRIQKLPDLKYGNVVDMFQQQVKKDKTNVVKIMLIPEDDLIRVLQSLGMLEK